MFYMALPYWADNAAVVMNDELLSFAYPKGAPGCQDASFEPPTIETDQGVRPLEIRKEQGKGWLIIPL